MRRVILTITAQLPRRRRRVPERRKGLESEGKVWRAKERSGERRKGPESEEKMGACASRATERQEDGPASAAFGSTASAAGAGVAGATAGRGGSRTASWRDMMGQGDSEDEASSSDSEYDDDFVLQG